MRPIVVQSVFNKLDRTMQQYGKDYFVVMGGDWNCTTDFIINPNGEEPHPQSGEILSSIIKKADLVDVWRSRNKTARQYTWLKVSGAIFSGARLDRIYVSSLNNNRVIDVSILPNGFSDHHMATVDINMIQMFHPKYYWHFNVKLLLDVMFVKCLLFFGMTGSRRKVHLRV